MPVHHRSGRPFRRHFAQAAFRATDRLADFPWSGRVVPETNRDDIREIFLYSYRIIYRVAGASVQILTVHHGARLLRGPLVRED